MNNTDPMRALMVPPVPVPPAAPVADRYADLVAVLATTPDTDASYAERVSWLWSLADELDEHGMDSLAEKARDDAEQLLGIVIDTVAGGEPA